MTVAPFVRFLMIVLSPVIFLVSLLIRLITLPLKDEHSGENTEEEAAAELQSIIETVEDEGVIDEDPQRASAQRARLFRDRRHGRDDRARGRRGARY